MQLRRDRLLPATLGSESTLKEGGEMSLQGLDEPARARGMGITARPIVESRPEQAMNARQVPLKFEERHQEWLANHKNSAVVPNGGG